MGDTLVAFKSKLFFQMSAQVYSVPEQTDGTRKPFLQWKCTILSLTCRGHARYYEIVHHPFGQTEGERKAFFEGCRSV